MTVFSINRTDHTVSLHSPTVLPNACGFLWNPKMMIQMNCRGYAQAQHMQPEPSKYAQGPALEAKTFMQPEHTYYAHHPGRFFYIKEHNKPLFSLPYEPVRQQLDAFEFIHQTDALIWQIRQHELEFSLKLTLAKEDAVEQWTMAVTNASDKARTFSVCPFFPLGYLSWMNQSADYNEKLGGVVAKFVPPYQKTEDWPSIKAMKSQTALLADTSITSWTASQPSFEGEGGLHNPDGLQAEHLPRKAAIYAKPVAALQHCVTVAPGETIQLRWLFGPAGDESEIEQLKARYFTNSMNCYSPPSSTTLNLDAPDSAFSEFVNVWLPRQMVYHAEVNRLTTDPQTRNYLQDQMGLVYGHAENARKAFLFALTQQSVTGAMPDGLLLHEQASLQYINQIPHTDHNVWLITFLAAYLRETADYAILDATVPFKEGSKASVYCHIDRAMLHLHNNLDDRGLSLILQGDWCDPMNQVGKEGRGVSAWLSMATAYCFSQWATICKQADPSEDTSFWQERANELNSNTNKYFWSGSWYGRGITDDGRLFGIAQDKEGSMFLNPQSWAVLCGALSQDKQAKVFSQIDERLETPYGPVLMAPAFTAMVEDIGRVTQKFPGTAENGSVYNHAAAFYAYALYQCGEANRAFNVLKNMLPTEVDIMQRGQLPVYIPNYFRGAYHQYPEEAGRSSHLFNTGTLPWYFQCVVEGLLGLVGTKQGLKIAPNLPDEWPQCSVTRHFRGCDYKVTYTREKIDMMALEVSGAQLLNGNIVVNPTASEVVIKVVLPLKNKQTEA